MLDENAVYMKAYVRDNETIYQYFERIHHAWIVEKKKCIEASYQIPTYVLDSIFFFENLMEYEAANNNKIQFVFGPERGGANVFKIRFEKDFMVEIMISTSTIIISNSMLVLDKSEIYVKNT